MVSSYANRAVTILNMGAFNITLSISDALSTTANRFTHPNLTAFVVAPNLMVGLLYDPAANAGVGAWRVFDNSLDGDRGDITVASAGTSMTINGSAVTTAKILNANVTVAKLAPQPYVTYGAQSLLTLVGNMVAVTAATTISVPTNASVTIPVGSRIDFLQTTAGQLTLSPAAGVTLSSANGLKTRAQWSALSLLKIGTDQWVVFGDTAV